MTASGPMDIAIGDVVRLRKTHPCGGTDWTVVRLGADIGLKCQTCGHRILLARSVLERRLKTFVSRPRPGDAGGELDASRQREGDDPAQLAGKPLAEPNGGGPSAD